MILTNASQPWNALFSIVFSVDGRLTSASFLHNVNSAVLIVVIPSSNVIFAMLLPSNALILLLPAGLKELGLTYTDPQGAYYVLVDVSEFGVKDDVKFCEWMAQYVGVAAVPGSSFFREDVHHLIRFHFAKKDDTLKEAIRRLATLREKALSVGEAEWK